MWTVLLKVCRRLPHLRVLSNNMASSDSDTLLAQLRLAVKEQGDLVRQLKQEGNSKSEVNTAVAELKIRKKALESKEKSLVPVTVKNIFDKAALEDLMKRRFFVAPSFSIYGGVAGLYDYGPLGCSMKSRLLSLWRAHFVEEEGMLEVECSTLTPQTVLKASGHVERFSDLMVKDLTTGEFFRADHLLTDHLQLLCSEKNTTPEQLTEYKRALRSVDGYNKEQLTEKLIQYNVTAPLTKNPLSPPVELNLMFSTSIGPSGQLASFLRPETAQGIFVNFKRLLEFNYGRLPFAAAQIGKAFRNEISPRSGLLRVREFEMAEIEHFVNPEKRNDFPKFSKVADLKLRLYSASDQLEGLPPQSCTLIEAIDKGLVGNRTMGYYLGRIHLFLLAAGVKEEHLRFRQHLPTEMAHYASDCWDAECETSYGWVECVGCADRSCFDLERHAAATKVDLCAREQLPQPRLVDVVDAVPDKAAIGKQYRKEAKVLLEWLSSLNKEQTHQLEKQLAAGDTIVTVADKEFSLKPSMVKFKSYHKEVHTIDVVPSVIEPSFGIGRILYSILEHNLQVRANDSQRVWLSLPPAIAPITCSVLPLSNNQQFQPFVLSIVEELKAVRVILKVDDGSGSIGRRYARTDEVGVAYGITVDFDTLTNSTVTLRERNSMRQVRIPVCEVGGLVRSLVDGGVTWTDVEAKYPIFTQQETTNID